MFKTQDLKGHSMLTTMHNDWELNTLDKKLINIVLEEDLTSAHIDITTQTVFTSNNKDKSAFIISKHRTDIVIAGLAVMKYILHKIDPKIRISTNYKDGCILKPQEILCEIKGNPASLLIAERTILNFLRHLSAIATLTKQFVDLVKHTNLKILDTRKTLPGLRHFEKHAVSCGGGINHRMGLYDAYMVKDTHIDLAGGLKTVLAKIPTKNTNKLPVIIEIRNLAELKTTIEYGKDIVTRVLLDNMSNQQLQECVDLCKGIFTTEASGNINLATIKDIAKTGVDFASVGMLTYAAGNVDLSMQIEC
jgi:nicotinate-nucleotide pyrophosphorylase (carboxylating)